MLIYVQAAHSTASALRLHCMLQEWTADSSLSAQLVKPSWLQQVDWGQPPGTVDHKWRSSVRRFVEPGQPVKPLLQTDVVLAGIMPPSPQPRSSSMGSSTHPIGRRSIGGRSSAGGDCMPASTMACGDTSAPTRKSVSVAEFRFASSPAAQSFPVNGGVAGKLIS